MPALEERRRHRQSVDLPMHRSLLGDTKGKAGEKVNKCCD
jgi:hypothetical protein